MSTATTLLDRPPALDADTFTALWREHRDDIRAYLDRRCPGAADELTSETFVRAWAGRRTYRPQAGSPRGWLFTIATNTLSDHLRRLACRPVVANFDWDTASKLIADPTDYAAQTVQRLAVYAALDTLPKHYRRVLTLRFLLDLDVPATAAVLGVPAGTVKSQTFRAARALSLVLTPGQAVTRKAG